MLVAHRAGNAPKNNGTKIGGLKFGGLKFGGGGASLLVN